VEIKFNSKWLGKMSFADVVSLASHFTVQQMLERDMFEQRMEEGKPIGFHEFMYPLMQGYDSVAMDVDGEVGGNDQTFNMLAGRTLMKQMKDKEKFVLTSKLLVDPTGTKMGKTEGNMIMLDDTAREMYGKVMSWSDGMILPGFELCTLLEKTDIEKIDAEMKKGGNPRDAKMKLAMEIVTFYHSKKEALDAEQEFLNMFQKGGMPEDVPSFTIKRLENYKIIELLVDAKLVDSNSEARRMIEQGGVKIDGEKISDVYALIAVKQGMIVQVGKRKFVKIKI
jgi:tyrosyl-tRNA synthetase